MRLLMASGDRQVAVGERGPFYALLSEFGRHFERIDVFGPRPERPVSTRELFGNVHLHPAACRRLGMPGYIRRAGSELCASVRPDLIVSHDYGWFYNGLGCAALSRASGVPYLSEIHHVPGHPRAADWRERFDKQVARAYVRWARHRCLAFRVVNTGEMPPLLESWGVEPAMIRVIPSLYIDLELFHPPRESVQAERDLIYVGRMVNNKGLDQIVDALALARQAGPAPRALFVGRGPLLERTRARVARKGLSAEVDFVPWVESPAQLAELYRTSRLLVCASTCEGGPRVTVEAMACGTPVVSTPVGVMGELLADGRCGRLAGFDAASLARSIVELLGDEPGRATAGRAAAELARRFEAKSAIAAYARALKELAGELAARPGGGA